MVDIGGRARTLTDQLLMPEREKRLENDKSNHPIIFRKIQVVLPGQNCSTKSRELQQGHDRLVGLGYLHFPRLKIRKSYVRIFKTKARFMHGRTDGRTRTDESAFASSPSRPSFAPPAVRPSVRPATGQLFRQAFRTRTPDGRTDDRGRTKLKNYADKDSAAQALSFHGGTTRNLAFMVLFRKVHGTEND